MAQVAYRIITTNASLSQVMAATERVMSQVGGTLIPIDESSFRIVNGSNNVSLAFTASINAIVQVTQRSANSFEITCTITKSPNVLVILCFIIGFFVVGLLWIICLLYFFVNPLTVYQQALDQIRIADAPVQTLAAARAPILTPEPEIRVPQPESRPAPAAPAPVTRVIISYRKEDTKALAGRLYDFLCDRFGENNVVLGVDKTILPGDDYEDAITQAIKYSTALVVLVGSHWQEGDWLNQAEDYDRLALRAALQNKKRFIPLLIDGAQLSSVALPEDLSGLVRRTGLSLSDDTFRADAAKLVTAIGGSA